MARDANEVRSKPGSGHPCAAPGKAAGAGQPARNCRHALRVVEFQLDSAAARTLITVVLCGALGVTAAVLIFRDSILTTWRAHFAELDARNTALVTVLVGAVLGVLVSISSVGAGAIGVMALVILYPRLSLVRNVGSDIAHAVPLTLIAGSDLLAIRRQLIPCGNRRVARSQYSVSGNDAELYLPRKGLLAEFVPGLVKFSLVPICPFGSEMVRRMRRTGRKVDKKMACRVLVLPGCRSMRWSCQPSRWLGDSSCFLRVVRSALSHDRGLEKIGWFRRP